MAGGDPILILFGCLTQTGQDFAGLGMHESAEGCFSKAMTYIPFLVDILNNSEDLEMGELSDICTFLFELYTDRAGNASTLKQPVRGWTSTV